MPVPAQAEARALRFQHLTVEKGLSHSWVHAVLKDSRGFLWVGTEDGLNRYDGSTIVVHRARPGDAHSLVSSQARSLFEDEQKRLWVGAGALHLYDRKRDRFDRFKLEEDPVEDLDVLAIKGDARGQIWVGTRRGLFRVDPTTGTTTHFRHDPQDATSLRHDVIFSLVLDRKGRLWVGTDSGLDRYDEETGRFVHLFQEENTPAWMRTMVVLQLLEDERGSLWLGTLGAGLLQFVPETSEVTRYLPDPGAKSSIRGTRIASLAADGKGRIYLGAEGAGLDVLEPSTGRVVNYFPHPQEAGSLSSATVSHLHFDGQGILWAGTFNAGVDYVSPFAQRFGLVNARRGELDNPHVLALLEDHRGAVWIGTDGGGLVRWDRQGGRFTNYRHDARRPDSLAADAILALHEDAEHNIWVGTWAAGLDRLDPLTGRFEHHRNQSARTDSIWTISPGGPGRLVLGTFDRGAQELDIRTGGFRPLAERFPGLIDNDQVLAMAVDPHGNLWLSEPGGPQYVDRKAGTVTRSPLSRGAPQAFHVDSRGNVWIGTDSGGLYCLPAGRPPARQWTVDDGLPSNNISFVMGDEAGHIWVGTTRGITRIEDGTRLPVKPQLLSFDVEDGLQGAEFKRGAAFRSSTGEMFFGGQQGFNFFHPRDVQTNPHVPPVVLTGLHLFNRPVPVGEPESPLAATTITEAEALTLSYRDSVVTFEFAALDFVVPSKNRYKYKLEGFDPAWNEIGGRRLATYTNLPPGAYTLRVAGSNNDGVWNEDGVRLPIRVLPPYWRTWLFQSMVAFGVLALAFGGHRWRLRQHLVAERLLKARIQDAMAEIKTLSGLLPICAWCKRIREDDGGWSQIETFVKDRTGADFTHGICPDCTERMRSGGPARPTL